MAIVADSGAVYALYDRRDSFHARVRSAVEKERDLIVLPAPTLGEIDSLLRVRLGNPALLRFLADIQEGASVVTVAERLGTDRVLTVDQRDFRAIRSIRGKPFRLLPADQGR